jgi:hypothetical protein
MKLLQLISTDPHLMRVCFAAREGHVAVTHHAVFRLSCSGSCMDRGVKQNNETSKQYLRIPFTVRKGILVNLHVLVPFTKGTNVNP